MGMKWKEGGVRSVARLMVVHDCCCVYFLLSRDSSVTNTRQSAGLRLWSVRL